LSNKNQDCRNKADPQHKTPCAQDKCNQSRTMKSLKLTLNVLPVLTFVINSPLRMAPS